MILPKRFASAVVKTDLWRATCHRFAETQIFGSAEWQCKIYVSNRLDLTVHRVKFNNVGIRTTAPPKKVQFCYYIDQMAGSELIQWSNNTEYLTSYKSENPRSFINEVS